MFFVRVLFMLRILSYFASPRSAVLALAVLSFLSQLFIVFPQCR